MVNKGRIHRELGKFFRYLWNSIKSDNELSLGIRQFSILIKIYKFTEYKIKWFGLEFAKKSKFKNERKFYHEIWLKTEIKLKLNLIYNSKCKSNAKWQKIKMKTRNLTQSRARNDPINRRIHGYSFRNFKDEDGIQDVISSYSLDQILISNTPRMWKWVKKHKKSNDSQIVVSRQFDLLENPRIIFRREEYSNL